MGRRKRPPQPGNRRGGGRSGVETARDSEEEADEEDWAVSDGEDGVEKSRNSGSSSVQRTAEQGIATGNPQNSKTQINAKSFSWKKAARDSSTRQQNSVLNDADFPALKKANSNLNSSIPEVPIANQNPLNLPSRLRFAEWVKKDLPSQSQERVEAVLNFLSSSSREELTSIHDAIKSKHNQVAASLPTQEEFLQATNVESIISSSIPVVEVDHVQHMQCAKNLITHSVVGYFTGGSLDFGRLVRWLSRMVRQQFLPVYQSIKRLSSNSFLLMFNSSHAVEQLVARGADPVGSGYILYQYYQPGVSPSASGVAKVPCWFSIPDLPLDLLVPEFLTKIGNTLGVHISHSIKNTPRVCIALPASQPMPDVFVIKSGSWLKKFDLQLLNGPELAKLFPQCMALSSYSVNKPQTCTASDISERQVRAQPSVQSDKDSVAIRPLKDNVQDMVLECRTVVTPSTSSDMVLEPQPCVTSSTNANKYDSAQDIVPISPIALSPEASVNISQDEVSNDQQVIVLEPHSSDVTSCSSSSDIIMDSHSLVTNLTGVVSDDLAMIPYEASIHESTVSQFLPHSEAVAGDRLFNHGCPMSKATKTGFRMESSSRLTFKKSLLKGFKRMPEIPIEDLQVVEHANRNEFKQS